jgi:8-oxo-dGTP pyrophosphatase MutT (NUDIX family)
LQSRMRLDSLEQVTFLDEPTGYGRARAKVAVDRVRCVLSHAGRYLLVQHNTRRRENAGKWALPGGRLKAREAPRVGLRRELAEELGLRVPRLIEVGDWWRRDENHRVFGCEVERPSEWFNEDEILAVDWLDRDQVSRLAAARRLHMGFELDAITEFQRKRSA